MCKVGQCGKVFRKVSVIKREIVLKPTKHFRQLVFILYVTSGYQKHEAKKRGEPVTC
jgi:hypothetical protein